MKNFINMLKRCMDLIIGILAIIFAIGSMILITIPAIVARLNGDRIKILYINNYKEEDESIEFDRVL